MAFSYVENYTDTTGPWHTELFFGGASGTNGIYHRTNGFDAVAGDTSVTWSDGVTRDPFAATVSGMLDIVAQYTSPATASTTSAYGTIPYSAFPYTGGLISMLGGFHMDYGTWQIVMKTAPGPGAENAFFSYAFTDYPSAKTTTEEVDFFEIYENASGQFVWAMSTHLDPTASGTKVSKTIYAILPSDPSAGFNTYTVDKSVANGIRGWFNNTQLVFYTSAGGSTVATLACPSPTTTMYPIILHDVDKTSSPVWGGNASVPADYTAPNAKHLQVTAVRAFRNSDTTSIGGARALITM